MPPPKPYARMKVSPHHWLKNTEEPSAGTYETNRSHEINHSSHTQLLLCSDTVSVHGCVSTLDTLYTAGFSRSSPRPWV